LTVIEEKEKSQELEQRMRGGVSSDDQEEVKGEVAEEEYLVSGLTQDVEALLTKVKNEAENPNNFQSVVIGGHEVS
jgi:hypothetical protein